MKFDHFDLYEIGDKPIVCLSRRNPNRRRALFKKHIQEGPGHLLKELQTIDFEIALASEDGDGFFNLDYAHVFSFLLMIRTGGWISAPLFLTHSALETPECDEPHIFCGEFISTPPAYFGDFQLTLDDAVWIKLHMDAALKLKDEPRFQNAMQALTSFHCVPYASIGLLVAWSGLEAVFGVDQEISFRLSLYIANFLNFGDDRKSEFEKLRRSYDDRSRVAHGAATKAKALSENAIYTRDVLRACLMKCVEAGTFPNARDLVF